MIKHAHNFISEEKRIHQINSLTNIEFLMWKDLYKNNKSIAMVRCSVDLFEWNASVHELVNSGTRCPQCSGKRRWTARERIEQINKLEGIEFVSWHDGYKNKNSKANVRCIHDSFNWSASVDKLINKGSRCPQCVKHRKWTGSERIEQINKLENIEFVYWDGNYKNCYSNAIVRCMIDGFEWSASVNNIVNHGSRCPKCAKYGYDKSKTGCLYALRSECGMYVKIGITNNTSQRHKQLEKATPFKFNLIEQIEDDGVKIAEIEKHFHSEYERAGFTGFDGSTEWLHCTDELLQEIREMGR